MRTFLGFILFLATALVVAPVHSETADDIASIRTRAERAFAEGKYADAVKHQQKLVQLIEPLDRTAGKPGKATAQALGVFAYYALFARRFPEALAASRRGRSLDPDEMWIDSNRAHALMYLGREKEALHLYLAHRSRRMPSGVLWQDDIEDDFVKLTDAGIGHAAMPRMMQALGIKQPRGAFERAALRAEMLTLDREENYAEALKRAQTHEALLRDRYGDAHIRYAEAVAFVGRYMYLTRNRNDLSEYRRALEIAERASGPDHIAIVPYLNNVIEIHQPTAAELSERAFAIVEKTYGADSPELLPALMQLGKRTQEFDKRLQSLERALALAKKYWPEDYDTLAPVMRELSRAYVLVRPQDAVTLHEQLVTMAERSKGVNSHEFSYAFHDLADNYSILDYHQNGDLRRQQTLDAYTSRLPEDHMALARHIAGLAHFYFKWGRADEAERLAVRGSGIVERFVSSTQEPLNETEINWYAEFLEAWAEAKSRQGLHAEAAALGEKIVSLMKEDLEAFRGRPQKRVKALGNLAREYYVSGQWGRATRHWQESTSLLVRAYRNPATAQALGNQSISQGSLKTDRWDREEHARWSGHFVGLIGGLFHTAARGDREVLKETFLLAQWALDLNSGQPIAQMAARSADPGLAALLKERDDLIIRVQDVRGIPSFEELARMETRITVLNKQIESDFPGASASIAPEPVSIDEVQSTLRGNEAVVLIVDGTPSQDESWLDDIFVWVITKSEARWTKASMNVGDLSRHARNLRCGLDASAWEPDARANDCGLLMPQRPSRDSGNNILWETLPYDLSRAYDVYNTLLKPMEDLLAGKHLLVVPSSALNQLPMHVLITRLPADTPDAMHSRTVGKLDITLRDVSLARQAHHGKGVIIERADPGGPADKAGLRSGDIVLAVADTEVQSIPQTIAAIRGHAPGSELSLRIVRNDQELKLTATVGELNIQERPPRIFKAGQDREIQWLARSNAITVLPSISALSSLRVRGKASTAMRPILGIGNPLLDGSAAEHASAQLARSKQSCPELVRLVRTASTRRPVRMGGTRGVYGRIANTAEILAQSPLPETADELCAVAASLSAAPDDVLLGQNATEATVKRLSQSGRLAEYRVLHFATHGTLGGEFEGLDQAGLLLTPPDKGSEEDDGYLSAHEITQLRINADWVVLSACNTAGRSLSHAQLPRAFFYAGARSLLASHWPVASEATVKLVTATLRNAASTPASGRAEALRQSMLSMIEHGEVHETHPAFWAPFVMMGEGAQ